jgi:hypothetical protein
MCACEGISASAHPRLSGCSKCNDNAPTWPLLLVARLAEVAQILRSGRLPAGARRAGRWGWVASCTTRALLVCACCTCLCEFVCVQMCVCMCVCVCLCVFERVRAYTVITLRPITPQANTRHVLRLQCYFNTVM